MSSRSSLFRLPSSLLLQISKKHSGTSSTNEEDDEESQVIRVAEEEGDEEDERERIAQALLNHAYHLPTNSTTTAKGWIQDWWQYMTNNHPVLGVCCHHPHHPISWQVRIAALLGSVFMGLAITNVIYLVFVFSVPDKYDYVYFQAHTNVTRTGWNEDLDDNVSGITVTNGNLALWTVGSFVHGLYDNFIWSLAACTCCMAATTTAATDTDNHNVKQKQRQYQKLGVLLAVESVVMVMGLATLTVVVRAAVEANHNSHQNDGYNTTLVNENTDWINTTNTSTSTINSNNATSNNFFQNVKQLPFPKSNEHQEYSFVVSYLVELILTYFLYFPIIGTILFSGILTCFTGRIAMIGGRPYELRQEQLEQQQETFRMQTSAHNNSNNNLDNNNSSRRSTFATRKSSTASMGILQADSNHGKQAGIKKQTRVYFPSNSERMPQKPIPQTSQQHPDQTTPRPKRPSIQKSMLDLDKSSSMNLDDKNKTSSRHGVPYKNGDIAVAPQQKRDISMNPSQVFHPGQPPNRQRRTSETKPKPKSSSNLAQEKQQHDNPQVIWPQDINRKQASNDTSQRKVQDLQPSSMPKQQKGEAANTNEVPTVIWPQDIKR